MKKSILALSLSFSCVVIVQAQRVENKTGAEGNLQNSAAVGQTGKTLNLESGTRLAAQLQSAVDARNAKVGDRVVLKTTQAIKSEGRTVVGKGARLIGHVTEVARKGKSSSESRLGIIFDRLEQGSLAMPITATITSITSGQVQAQAGDDVFAGSAGGSTRTSSSSAGNTSLLGGVGGVVNSTTSTVGSAVGTTTSAVGSTVNSTANTVGGTTSGLGRSLGRIRISESSNTSVQGGSVLSLQGDNLRLEKGTSFNLVLMQSASAGTAREE